MGILADVVIDRHILDGFTIAGLLLGVLGSLYLAYEFLNRRHKILKWMTRIFTFTLGGALCYLVLYGVDLLFASFSSPLFLRELVGVMSLPATFIEFTVSVGTLSIFFFIERDKGGKWVSMMTGRPLAEKPPLFVWKSVGLPLIIMPFLFVVLVGNILFAGPPMIIFQVSFIRLAATFTVIAEATGWLVIVGGFADYLNWWTENLPELGWATIGIALILLSFLLALAQPLADILNLPVH